MGYRESMARCKAYIDGHLSEEISVDELARMFGYSLYHFCRIFKSSMDVSVAAYVRRRRLELAARDLLNGRRIADAAAAYGFDTPSGFSKAFRKHYGSSPTEYKTQKGGLHPMTPEIKKMPEFSAIGYCLAPPEGELDVLDSSAYWLGKDFSSVSKEDYNRLMDLNSPEIGMWMHPSGDGGNFYYFFGPIVKDKTFIPDSMKAVDVPEAEYAVFAVPAAGDLKGLNENIRRTWKYIFTEWFDSSDYAFDESKIDFEYYLGENTYIYVPVLKK